MQGIPLYTVQRPLGHQSSTMTERYSHLTPDHRKEAVTKLEKFVNKDKKSLSIFDNKASHRKNYFQRMSYYQFTKIQFIYILLSRSPTAKQPCN